MWSDKITRFKAKPHGSHGFVPVLLLMYLSLGEDYGYRMAKTLKNGISEKNGWDASQIEIFDSVRDRSQLQRTLNKMKEQNLLLSDGISPKFFRLNPEILRNPDGSATYYKKRDVSRLPRVQFRCPKCGFEVMSKRDNIGVAFEIPEELITELLINLSEKTHAKNEENPYEPYFKKWGKIESFDFNTFINFLKGVALELNMNEMALMLSQYILEIEEAKRREKFEESLHRLVIIVLSKTIHNLYLAKIFLSMPFRSS
jgi:hypothetical protein